MGTGHKYQILSREVRTRINQGKHYTSFLPKNSLTTKSLVLRRQCERIVRLGHSDLARGRERVECENKNRIGRSEPGASGYRVQAGRRLLGHFVGRNMVQ